MIEHRIIFLQLIFFNERSATDCDIDVLLAYVKISILLFINISTIKPAVLLLKRCISLNKIEFIYSLRFLIVVFCMTINAVCLIYSLAYAHTGLYLFFSLVLFETKQ